MEAFAKVQISIQFFSPAPPCEDGGVEAGEDHQSCSVAAAANDLWLQIVSHSLVMLCFVSAQLD